jgi:Fe2+-dicitrate sensor, membrane component
MYNRKEQEAQHIAKLLLKELRRELTVEEQEILDKWKDQSEENRRLYREVAEPEDPTILLEELRLYNANIALANILGQTERKFRKFNWTFVKVAAAVLLLIGGIAWHYKQIFVVDNPEKVHFYRVAKGERSRFQLPDSTNVWLNAGSSLSFVEDRKAHRRIAVLVGEAYFEVKHDAENPFNLSLPDSMQVQVLGTTFNVKAYPGEQQSSVSLRSGRVKVGREGLDKNGAELILQPGQEALWKDGAGRWIKKEVDTATIADWRENVIRFEDEPLRDIISTLERRYDLEIRVKENTLLDKHVSIKLGNSSFKDVLETLSFSLGFRYRIVDKHTIIID